MSDLEKAIEVVARDAVWRALNVAVENGHIEWGDYPDIGENDWNAITMHVLSIAGSFRTQRDEFSAGYALLSKRAEGETPT